MITIKKGLDLPIAGNPDQVIHDIKAKEVAIVGASFINFKPTLKAREGDKVIKGQVLLIDKKHPKICFTSPASGTVVKVNRGERRVFQSLVIEVDANSTEYVTYDIPSIEDSEACKELLLNAGLWAAIRTRPFNNLADPDLTPNSLFINAHDTNPGHANADVILYNDHDAFKKGLEVLASVFKDVEHKFVCGGPQLSCSQVPGFTYETFSGPHPAGLVGTHINKLCPVTLNKVAYHLNYSDVIQIGKLFINGYLDLTRVIALSGPQVKNPTLYRVPFGINVHDVASEQRLKDGGEGGNRIISGSCLDGYTAQGPFTYLGHYDLQISVLREGIDQEFIGWFAPQPKKFSLSRLNFFGRKNLPLTTSTNGSARGQVPIGLYERVMPLDDIYPTLLLRDLIACDTDSAQDQGILELAEEDVALCSFVCEGKYDYAIYLRAALNKIEKEG